MVKYLYQNFLNNSLEYEQSEAIWRERWHELLRWLGQHGQWRSPWLNTNFANGTPCRDGKPIFSAVCISRRLGVRVNQLEPSGNPRELHFWTDTYGEGEPEAVRESVISCVLTPETLLDALDLMNQWIAKEQVWLSQEGYYPTFPLAASPIGRRSHRELVAA
jgi:hypothetical protein